MNDITLTDAERRRMREECRALSSLLWHGATCGRNPVGRMMAGALDMRVNQFAAIQAVRAYWYGLPERTRKQNLAHARLWCERHREALALARMGPPMPTADPRLTDEELARLAEVRQRLHPE